MISKDTVRSMFEAGELDFCDAAFVARALRKEGHEINSRVEDEFAYVVRWCQPEEPPFEQPEPPEPEPYRTA